MLRHRPLLSPPLAPSFSFSPRLLIGPPFSSIVPLLLLLIVSLLAVSGESYESSELRMMDERGAKRMFYQPWSYMKRTTTSVDGTADLFEKSQFLKGLKWLSSSDQFGKRSNVVPLMRFGRRPAERAAPLIRFGKRAHIRTDAAPLIRFGRSSEERK